MAEGWFLPVAHSHKQLSSCQEPVTLSHLLCLRSQCQNEIWELSVKATSGSWRLVLFTSIQKTDHLGWWHLCASCDVSQGFMGIAWDFCSPFSSQLCVFPFCVWLILLFPIIVFKFMVDMGSTSTSLTSPASQHDGELRQGKSFSHSTHNVVFDFAEWIQSLSSYAPNMMGSSFLTI